MRALNYERYGGIDALQIGEISVPEVADDEVLIRVHAASLNPFDWKLRNGMLRDFFEIEFPITPGRNGCGEIMSLGKSTGVIVRDEEGFKKGIARARKVDDELATADFADLIRATVSTRRSTRRHSPSCSGS